MGNMHLVTGYAGKEHVTSDDQGSFNAAFFGKESFVLNGKDKFDYEIISNTEIKIKPGDFYTQGRFIRLQNPVVLNFEVGSQEGARIDSVYIKYEKNLQTEIESCDLIVVDGRNAEELKRVQQQSLKKDAILKGENEAYFLMYNVQFNGLNLSNIQKKFEIKENYKQEFEKFASNADDFLKNKVKQTNEALNSLIEKTDTNLKKKFENADLIGELKNLNTKNKTNLVNAINEVFQFGVDKGNKIVSKLNALFDKDFKNLNQIAEEINKCKISSILQYYSSIEINDYYNCLVGTKIFNDNKFYDIEQKKYLKNGNFNLENNNDIFYKLDINENKSDYQYLIDSKNNAIHNDYYGDLRKYSNSGYGGLYIKLNGKLKIITINKYNDDITEILGVNESREESFKTKGKLFYANDSEIFYYDDKNSKLYIYNHNFQLKKSINVDDFVKRCYFIGNVYVYDKYYSNDEDKIKIYDKTWSLKRSEEIPKKMFSVSRNVKRLFGLPNSKELYFYQMYKNKYSNYDDNLKGKIFFYKINENGILTKENTFDNFLPESCDIYYNKKFIVSMNFNKEITIFKISKVLERK